MKKQEVKLKTPPINLFYWLFLFAILSCCGNQNKDGDGDSSVEMTNADNASEKLSVGKFADFWMGFRNSMIRSGTDSIMGFVEIPLKVRGYEDLDPKFEIVNSDSIKLFLDVFMKENTVNVESLHNHLQLIENLKKPEDYSHFAPSEDWIRIENMEFQKTRFGWKLSEIYINTKLY